MNLFIYQTVDGDIGFIEAKTFDEALLMVRAFVDKTKNNQIRKAKTNERNTNPRQSKSVDGNGKKKRSSSRSGGDAKSNSNPSRKDSKTRFATDPFDYGTRRDDNRLDRQEVEPPIPVEVFRAALADVLKAGREVENDRMVDLLIKEGVIWQALDDSEDDDNGSWRAGDYLFIAGIDEDGYLVIKPLKGLRP